MIRRESLIEPILVKDWINWFADRISHFKNSVSDSPLLYVHVHMYHIFDLRPINLICGIFIWFHDGHASFPLIGCWPFFYSPEEANMRAWSRGPNYIPANAFTESMSPSIFICARLILGSKCLLGASISWRKRATERGRRSFPVLHLCGHRTSFSKLECGLDGDCPT